MNTHCTYKCTAVAPGPQYQTTTSCFHNAIKDRRSNRISKGKTAKTDPVRDDAWTTSCATHAPRGRLGFGIRRVGGPGRFSRDGNTQQQERRRNRRCVWWRYFFILAVTRAGNEVLIESIRLLNRQNNRQDNKSRQQQRHRQTTDDKYVLGGRNLALGYTRRVEGTWLFVASMVELSAEGKKDVYQTNVAR